MEKKLPKWRGWDGAQPLSASAACPICRVSTPHAHYDDNAEVELIARPTFEFFLRRWFDVYLPDKRARRGSVLGAGNWTSLQRSESRPPDYANPTVEALWGLWLDAWLSKPSWCNAFDKVAMQKQIERQTPQPFRD